MKALVSYQSPDNNFSSQFLGMLEREGHLHLHTNGMLPNGAPTFTSRGLQCRLLCTLPIGSSHSLHSRGLYCSMHWRPAMLLSDSASCDKTHAKHHVMRRPSMAALCFLQYHMQMLPDWADILLLSKQAARTLR
jgi:hypothetical protein